jgi:5-methylcytosine-specific restriction endonuclease McrA
MKLLELARKNKYICHFCNKKIKGCYLTRDHKIPKSRGGTGSWENTLLSCKKCNLRKADMSYEEFIKRIKWRPLGIKKPDCTLLVTTK